MDAKRVKDGAAVCLKAVYRTPKEAQIAKYFSSPELLQEPTNHSVPILDVFQDPSTPDFEYLVMPLLRPFDDPDFTVVGEVVDFVTQILEVRVLNYHSAKVGTANRVWHLCILIILPMGM